MKWRVTKGNQGYKISAYSSSSRVVAAGSTSAGENLTLATWTNDTDYLDEWEFFGTKLTVNLDVLYDVAYVNRYADAVDRITDQMIEMQKKYLTVFGIYINYSVPTQISSYADLACTINPNQRCTHAEDEVCENSVLSITGDVDFKTFHHTNIYNIVLRLDIPNPQLTFRVLYTGHNNCVSNNEDNQKEHLLNPYYGFAYMDHGLMAIMNFSHQSSMTKTLIHELGHFYGAPDHYDTGGEPSTDELNAENGGNKFNSNCIYGENKEDDLVLDDFTICEGCKEIIKSNQQNYLHRE